MLRALIVGSGWGRYAGEAFGDDPRVELCGIVGRGSPRTSQLAAQLRVPVFDSLNVALSAIRPEIAAVAVAEGENEAIAERLILAGAHVLCSHPVAPDAPAVQRMGALAEKHGRLIATDYTLRLSPAFVAARNALSLAGPVLRSSVRCPGRALVMGIDLALAFGGPAAQVYAAGRYPASLAERRRKMPAAFPPLCILEHHGGAVTTIMPAPHALPAFAHRIEISALSARIDVALPAGGASEFRNLGGGRVVERELWSPAAARSSQEIFGSGMRSLVHRFVDSVVEGIPVHAPLVEEYQVRATWAALRRSSIEERPAVV